MQKNLGGFGGLEVTQGHRKHNHFIEHTINDFLFDFNRNYASKSRTVFEL